MTQYLMMDYRDTTVACYGVDVLTISQIGGNFHRETPIAAAASSALNGENRACQIGGKAYAVHCSSTSLPYRFYEFDPLAYKCNVGSYTTTQAGFHGFAAGDTWTASGGATGTFIEAGVATDTFIVLKFTMGTAIGSGEVITISSGSGTGAATTTEAAFQGGAAAELGEWKVVHTSSVSGRPIPTSGLHSMIINDKMGIGCMYHAGAGTSVYGVDLDVDTGVWTEALIGNFILITSDYWGRSTVINDTIYVATRDEVSAFNYCTVSFNPTTQAYGVQHGASMCNSNWTDETGAYICCEWKGRIFMLMKNSSANGCQLSELTGGTWGLVPDCNFNGNTISLHPDWYLTSQTNAGNMIFEQGGKLWAAIAGDINNGTNGWWVFTFTEKAGVISCDSQRGTTGGGITNTDRGEKLSQVFWPLADLAVHVGSNLGTYPRLRCIRDQTANSPSGQDKMMIYAMPDAGTAGSGSPTVEVMEWGDPWVTISFEIDWTTATALGTEERYYFETVEGVDPTLAGLVDNADYIGLTSDERIFKFRGTATSPNRVILQRTGTLGASSFPTTPTSGLCRKLVGPTHVGTGGFGSLSIADESLGGGGREFRKGDKNAIIVGVTPAINKELIAMRCYGGGTATISLYHGLANDELISLKSTISNPGGQPYTISAGDMTGVPADGSVVLVNHDVATDSLTSGQVIRRCFKVI